jgi:hypothetical protein
MVQLMEPGARQDTALRIFFQKIARMSAYKEPVLPLLTNVEQSGIPLDEVRARLAAAGADGAQPPGG